MRAPAYNSTTAEEEVLFEVADAKYAALKKRLVGGEVLAMTHSEVENLVESYGRDVLRELLQGHLDLRALAEPIAEVRGADGVERGQRRTGTKRSLGTVLGDVEVARTRYGARGASGLHPVDADLNLPVEKYSLEVRRRVALSAARTSFDATAETVAASTGAAVPKRQVEQLTRRAAVDFEEFYEETALDVPPRDTGELLVLTTDGKGVVMRSEHLREPTRKAAEDSRHKLSTRLSKGEKRNRKRMALVAAVFTVATWLRTPDDVIAGLRSVRGVEPADRPPRPRPEHKRVWASIERPAEQVIREAFDEGLTRDPNLAKRWVVVVDGQKSQLQRIQKEAKRRGIELTIVLDFIHVLEYLWKAARVFNAEASPEAEEWVLERLRRILCGQAGLVAAAIRRSATKRHLTSEQRAPADTAANYIAKHAPYMRYDEYLADGLPIASGVIEGACRHLINDRLGITGARWSLDGAEAVLKIRALLSSSDFAEYWAFHEQQEFERNHATKYAQNRPPKVARPRPGSHLRVVK
jgi:hypothetical protein